MATAPSSDLLLLEELDFPVPCGHSRHDDGAPWHGGETKFVAVSYHRCQANPQPTPHYYPCCEFWAAYVMHATAYSQTIQCSRCGVTGYWEDMVAIVSTLT